MKFFLFKAKSQCQHFFLSLDPCDRIEKCTKPFAKCIKQVDHTAVCKCPVCPKDIYSPICGDNGLTYASQCFMERENCLQGTDIQLSRNEPCGMYLRTLYCISFFLMFSLLK